MSDKIDGGVVARLTHTALLAVKSGVNGATRYVVATYSDPPLLNSADPVKGLAWRDDWTLIRVEREGDKIIGWAPMPIFMKFDVE